jgi:hypothetical protein
MEAEPFARECTFFGCDLYATLDPADVIILAGSSLFSPRVEIDLSFDYDPPPPLEWNGPTVSMAPGKLGVDK